MGDVSTDEMGGTPSHGYKTVQKVFEEEKAAATVGDVRPEMTAVWRSEGGAAALVRFFSLFRWREQFGEDKSGVDKFSFC